MVVTFLLGLFTASWLGAEVITGVAFLGGSATAARYARRAALLTVSVTPPVLFFCALVATKAMTASGNVVLSTAEGSLLTLARSAPWLLAGTAVSLAIAWFRGLPQCISDLREDLRDNRSRRPEAG